jgi:hydroxymethylpyrimidine pyrophosphatase-like HAD family hydrolase
MVIGYITGRARTMQNEIDNGKIFFTDKYNLPKDFIAYYNGAEIYAENISIESNTIPYESAMKIIRGLDKIYPNAKIGIYHEPWSYLKRSGCIDGENWNLETGEKVKCGIFELPNYNVQRIRIEFDKHDDKNKLNEILAEDTIFFANADGSAMIVNNNATKERAAKKASKYFNIPLADIISFGDDINDMKVLKISGVGVAMGNAINAVKEAADYVTETNDSEGISVWINKYVLTNNT